MRAVVLRNGVGEKSMLIGFMVRPKPRRGQCRSARFPGVALCAVERSGTAASLRGREAERGVAACRVAGDAAGRGRMSNVAREGADAGKSAVTKTTRVFSKRAIWRQRWTRAATVD